MRPLEPSAQRSIRIHPLALSCLWSSTKLMIVSPTTTQVVPTNCLTPEIQATLDLAVDAFYNATGFVANVSDLFGCQSQVRRCPRQAWTPHVRCLTRSKILSYCLRACERAKTTSRIDGTDQQPEDNPTSRRPPHTMEPDVSAHCGGW